MERRRSKRKPVHISTRIEAHNERYDGIIENMSEHGLSVETDAKDLLGNSSHFNPGSEYRLHFQTSSGDDIQLHCKVIWSYITAPHGLKRKIGVEIIFPPPHYVDFYRELQ